LKYGTYAPFKHYYIELYAGRQAGKENAGGVSIERSQNHND